VAARVDLREPSMKRNSLLLITSIALAIAFVATAAGDPAIDASKSSIIATSKRKTCRSTPR